MKKLMTTAAVLITLIASAVSAAPLTLTPDLCGIHGNDGVWNNMTDADAKRIGKYCDDRYRKALADDPGGYVMGRIEKAEPVKDDPNSKFYYWLEDGNPASSGPRYFDARSNIGKKILEVCPVSSVCALKVSIRKSWELNVSHATFWIVKVNKVTRVGQR